MTPISTPEAPQNTMDTTFKPVTTMPTNSTTGVGECVDDSKGSTKPSRVSEKDENRMGGLDSPPFELVYSSKESARVRWKLDLILLPLVSTHTIV